MNSGNSTCHYSETTQLNYGRRPVLHRAHEPFPGLEHTVWVSTNPGFLSWIVQMLEIVVSQSELLFNQDKQVKNALKG